MRATDLLLPITIGFAAVAGYVAGHAVGESEGLETGAGLAFNRDASRSAEAFVLASSVRQALRESKPAQAELAAIRYAATKVPSLLGCQSSPDCAAAVGRIMPTKAQLDEALAADRAARSRP